MKEEEQCSLDNTAAGCSPTSPLPQTRSLASTDIESRWAERRSGHYRPVTPRCTLSKVAESSNSQTKHQRGSMAGPKPRGTTVGLMKFVDLEEWQRDNNYIRSGYRKLTNSYWKALKTIPHWHNESVNIVSSSSLRSLQIKADSLESVVESFDRIFPRNFHSRLPAARYFALDLSHKAPTRLVGSICRSTISLPSSETAECRLRRHTRLRNFLDFRCNLLRYVILLLSLTSCSDRE